MIATQIAKQPAELQCAFYLRAAISESLYIAHGEGELSPQPKLCIQPNLIQKHAEGWVHRKASDVGGGVVVKLTPERLDQNP